MKQQFDFKQLVQHIQKQAGNSLSKQELEELLLINEEAYQKDSPLSVGKSLRDCLKMILKITVGRFSSISVELFRSKNC